MQLTRQAERQLERLPEALQADVRAFVDGRKASYKTLGPCPFGQGTLKRYRIGQLRVLVADTDGDRTVLGFGLRRD